MKAKEKAPAFPDHPNRGSNWMPRAEVVHVAGWYSVNGCQVCDRCGEKVSSPPASPYEPGQLVAVVDHDPHASWRVSRPANCQASPEWT